MISEIKPKRTNVTVRVPATSCLLLALLTVLIPVLLALPFLGVLWIIEHFFLNN